MKFNYLLFCSLVLFVSCQKDDDSQDVTPITNSFFFEDVERETPFAYLIFDTDAPFNDNYVLVFSEKTVTETTNNGIAFDITTDHFISLVVKNSGATVATEQDVDVSVGAAPVDVGDSGAMIGITSWTDVFGGSGTQFGQPAGVVTFLDLDAAAATATANILSVNLDYTARSGYIEVDYTMMDANGKNLQGSFYGPLKILNAF